MLCEQGSHFNISMGVIWSYKYVKKWKWLLVNRNKKGFVFQQCLIEKILFINDVYIYCLSIKSAYKIAVKPIKNILHPDFEHSLYQSHVWSPYHAKYNIHMSISMNVSDTFIKSTVPQFYYFKSFLYLILLGKEVSSH